MTIEKMMLTDQAVIAILDALKVSVGEDGNVEGFVPMLKRFVFDIDGKLPGENFNPLIILNPVTSNKKENT